MFSLFTWLAGTRLGRAIAAGGAFIAILGGVYLRGRLTGSQRAKRKAKEIDHAAAKKVTERADDALRRVDGDNRPVDDKLGDIGGFRD
jgi:hypothetical protein